MLAFSFLLAEKFSCSAVEHENSFITSGQVCTSVASCLLLCTSTTSEKYETLLEEKNLLPRLIVCSRLERTPFQKEVNFDRNFSLAWMCTVHLVLKALSKLIADDVSNLLCLCDKCECWDWFYVASIITIKSDLVSPRKCHIHSRNTNHKRVITAEQRKHKQKDTATHAHTFTEYTQEASWE